MKTNLTSFKTIITTPLTMLKSKRIAQAINGLLTFLLIGGTGIVAQDYHTRVIPSSSQNTVVVVRSDINPEDQDANQTCDIDFQLWDNNTHHSTPQGSIGMVGHSTFNQALEASGRMAFYTASAQYPGTTLYERMRITETGNIGIGLTDPSSKLEINGDLKIRSGNFYINSGSNNSLRIGGNTNTTGYINIHQPGTIYNTFLDYTENFYIRKIIDNLNGPESLAQPNPTVMGFQYDGTVTIGIYEKYTHSVVSNPDNHKLLVNGGISCERLKVVADVPNSDHVFEKGYELMSLEEVNNFVKENKHLPEIPSAQEFKENGYYVGEMDDVLLRKVEELTLYIIELQNRITNLEQK